MTSHHHTALSATTLALAVAALTSCGTTAAQPPEPHSATITPTAIRADSGCSIAVTGHALGAADPAMVPRSLTLTCDGRSQVLSGDFTNKTSNVYDLDSTDVHSALIVNGEARIWHAHGPVDQGCITIQRLDEASASQNKCDPESLALWNDPHPSADQRHAVHASTTP